MQAEAPHLGEAEGADDAFGGQDGSFVERQDRGGGERFGGDGRIVHHEADIGVDEGGPIGLRFDVGEGGGRDGEQRRQGKRGSEGSHRCFLIGTSLIPDMRAGSAAASYIQRRWWAQRFPTYAKRRHMWATLDLLFGLEVGEDLVGVAFGLYLAPDVADGAVGGDEEGGALDAHDFFAVHVLFLEDAVEGGDFFFGVGQEGVGQAEFFLELLLRLGSVRGDAEDGEAGAG